MTDELTIAIQVEITALRTIVSNLVARTDNLERILVLGDNDRLPLAEIVRNIGKYIEKQEKKEIAEQDAKKEQNNRWKWLILGIVVPAVLLFAWQFILFYVRVLPALEQLTQ